MPLYHVEFKKVSHYSTTVRAEDNYSAYRNVQDNQDTILNACYTVENVSGGYMKIDSVKEIDESDT